MRAMEIASSMRWPSSMTLAFDVVDFLEEAMNQTWLCERAPTQDCHTSQPCIAFSQMISWNNRKKAPMGNGHRVALIRVLLNEVNLRYKSKKFIAEALPNALVRGSE